MDTRSPEAISRRAFFQKMGLTAVGLSAVSLLSGGGLAADPEVSRFESINAGASTAATPSVVEAEMRTLLVFPGMSGAANSDWFVKASLRLKATHINPEIFPINFTQVTDREWFLDQAYDFIAAHPGQTDILAVSMGSQVAQMLTTERAFPANADGSPKIRLMVLTDPRDLQNYDPSQLAPGKEYLSRLYKRLNGPGYTYENVGKIRVVIDSEDSEFRTQAESLAGFYGITPRYNIGSGHLGVLDESENVVQITAGL